MTMDAAVKDAWTEALLSGEFPQGKGTLKDDAGHYCCLGVLATVLRDQFPQVLRYAGCVVEEYDKPILSESSGLANTIARLTVTTDKGETSSGVLPPELANAVGITSQTALYTRNDDGYSFEGIAAFIVNSL